MLALPRPMESVSGSRPVECLRYVPTTSATASPSLVWPLQRLAAIPFSGGRQFSHNRWQKRKTPCFAVFVKGTGPFLLGNGFLFLGWGVPTKRGPKRQRSVAAGAAEDTQPRTQGRQKTRVWSHPPFLVVLKGKPKDTHHFLGSGNSI